MGAQIPYTAGKASGVPQDAQSIVRQLEAVGRIIDGRFMDACDLVSPAIASIGGLITALDKLAAEFDSDFTPATRAELTVAAAKLCTLPANKARQVEIIASLNRSSEKVAHHTRLMRNSLSVVETILRDTGFPNEMGTGPVDQIAEVVEKSNAELRAVETQLAALRRGLELASVQGEVRNRKLAALIPGVPEELAATAGLLKAQQNAVAAMAERISAIGRDIHGQLVNILTVLQFGDITRQRIEHILSMIARVEADCQVLPSEVQTRFRATCYALIGEQLCDVCDDVLCRVSAFHTEMDQVSANTTGLLAAQARAFEGGSHGRCGVLQTVAWRIDAVRGLFTSIEAADKTAHATERATIRAAHELSRHIERIRALRCEMVAGGKAMAPNATLTHAAVAGDAALNELCDLAEAIAAVTGKDRLLDSKLPGAASALALAAKRIHEAKDVVEADINDVAEKGEAVVRLLTSERPLDINREIYDSLAAAAAFAVQIGSGAYGSGDLVPDTLATTLQALSTFYSMASERRIHARFVAQFDLPWDETTSQAHGDNAILF